MILLSHIFSSDKQRFELNLYFLTRLMLQWKENKKTTIDRKSLGSGEDFCFNKVFNFNNKEITKELKYYPLKQISYIQQI